MKEKKKEEGIIPEGIRIIQKYFSFFIDKSVDPSIDIKS